MTYNFYLYITNTTNIGTIDANSDGVVSFTITDEQSDLNDISYILSTDDDYTKYISSFSQETKVINAIEYVLSNNSTDPYSVLFTDVTDISFSNTDVNSNYDIDTGENVGDMVFGFTDSTHSAITNNVPSGYTAKDILAFHYPSGSDRYGDIWVSTDTEWADYNDENTWDDGAINVGTNAYLTLLHEVGHALGLSHPTNSLIDNQKYTVMSYNEVIGMKDSGNDLSSSVFPSGLQLYDIAALQEEYGRNYYTRDTDTTYSASTSFLSNNTYDAFVYTIWDGGGNDTIDASAYTNSQGATIDLRQGEFSSIGYNANGGAAVDNVAIAYHTVIENATGTNDTNAGDILIGNAWSNNLVGLLGDDKLYGDGYVYDGAAGFTSVEAVNPDGLTLPPKIGPFFELGIGL